MGDPDAQYELGCRLRVEVKLLIFVASECIVQSINKSKVLDLI